MGRLPFDRISFQTKEFRSIAKTSLKAEKPFQPPKMKRRFLTIDAEWAARGEGRLPEHWTFWQNMIKGGV